MKQLRKDREEERTARELLEEMQQTVEEAQERASESEWSLCRELEEQMYSWDREIGRPHNLSTKTWKSDAIWNSTTSAEILEKIHQAGVERNGEIDQESGLKRKRIKACWELVGDVSS